MPTLLQVVSALAIVLTLIAGSSWLLRKLHSKTLGRGQLIHIEAAVSVGTRERVVLIEIGGEWLLIGVATGSINTLLRLNESPLKSALPIDQKVAAKSWLETYLAKIHAA